MPDMQAFLSASSAREMVALLAGMRARIFFGGLSTHRVFPHAKE